jgi:hypothetical protein
MRRILSILVALVLGLGPAMAAVPANALASGWTGKIDESRLPACCRRNGKHHCAMASTGQTDEATGKTAETTVSANDSCPLMPRTLASTAPSVAALLHAMSSSTLLPTRACAQHGSAAAAQISEQRSWPKRGPPAQIA